MKKTVSAIFKMLAVDWMQSIWMIQLVIFFLALPNTTDSKQKKSFQDFFVSFERQGIL